MLLLIHQGFTSAASRPRKRSHAVRLPRKSNMILVGIGEDGIGIGSVHVVVARRRPKADPVIGQAPVVTRRICELLVRLLAEQELV